MRTALGEPTYWTLILDGLPFQLRRSETVGAIQEAATKRRAPRCPVHADGFYEWQRTGKAKQPYCFEVNGGELFAFAGLWERWKNASGDWVKTCSILTTTPNAVTATVHDRMPVILDPDSYDLWLDPGITDAHVASELLKPFDAKSMKSYPVSARVNSVVNDDEECSRRVELLDTQNRLFV